MTQQIIANRHKNRSIQVKISEEKMTAKLIDGTKIASDIHNEILSEVEKMKDQYGRVPGLATVLVGTRRDSETYVNMKTKACKKMGIQSYGQNLPENISQDDLINVVQELNSNPEVHGILVQLPLPPHINEEEILAAISLEKDVDGFHPINIGRLSMKRRDPLFVPCTPKGCIVLLERSGIKISGKHAVVLGRSNIVGLPVAMLLLHRNATVTLCHSYTQNLPEMVRQADILVAAVGKVEMVRGDWVKPGAAIIDVGMNSIDDPSSKKGYRLVGDVAFDEVKEVASAITPVPGGVGPMTIAMLLRNTLDSAKRLIPGLK